jgi:hypothetical protein
MTPEAERAEWVERELTHPENNGKPIAPLVLGVTRFWSLSNIQDDDVRSGRMPQQWFVDGPGDGWIQHRRVIRAGVTCRADSHTIGLARAGRTGPRLHGTCRVVPDLLLRWSAPGDRGRRPS